MVYRGEDFERKYKLSMKLIKLNECGLITDDEVDVLRRWFKLNSFVWISAEIDFEKENEKNNGCE